MNLTLRQKIKIALISKNITEITLAKKMGISRTHLRRMVSGERPLIPLRKKQISDILEVSEEYLFGQTL